MQSNRYFLISCGVAVAVVASVALAITQSRQPEAPVGSAPNSASPSVVVSPAPSPSALPEPSPDAPAAQSNATVGSSATDSDAITIETCTIKMAQVDDPNSPLNLRPQPDTTGEPIAKLDNGTWLSVLAERGEWLQVKPLDGETAPTGWVARKLTRSTCNLKIAQITLQPGSTGLKIKDRFVGTGSHTYKLNITEGQTLVVSDVSGPAPVLLNASGETITPLAQADDTNMGWSQKIPKTGEYLLELDSNAKGYDYQFAIALR